MSLNWPEFRLRRRARLSILVLGGFTVALGLLGLWALNQSQKAASELQARTLNNISSAMSLAEQAAQIAAQAPYLGDSAQPFQLQSEQLRLDARFQNLERQIESISDPEFQDDLRRRVSELKRQLNRLVDLVQDELFLQEDLMVTRFEIDEWFDHYLGGRSEPASSALSARLHLFRQHLIASSGGPLDNSSSLPAAKTLILQQLSTSALSDTARRELTELMDQGIELAAGRDEFHTTKTLLFADNRARSDALTRVVQRYVDQVESRLADQRQLLDDAAQWGLAAIGLVSALALLALIEGFLFMSRATRDLERVTRDMTQLADGSTESPQPAVERRDEIGELSRTFSVFRKALIDIQQVSHERDRQARLLESVLNSMNDGLSVFSAERRLLTWNDRYLEIFGLSRRLVREEMAIEDIRALMERDTFRTVSLTDETLDDTTIDEKRARESLTFERHYNSGKVIEFRSEPMADGGFVTLHSDLTDRRAVEQQLVQAQKMEVLGQLTGGVAHDFNNLLAALIGNLQLLDSSDNLPAMERHYAQRALDVAERGAHLVERLLAFSRKQRLHPEPVDVGGLLEGMLDLIEYSVSPNVTVHLHLGDGGRAVWVDPSQLENAILNLAINGSAAMPHGGDLKISARLRENQNEAHRVEIEVRDTGTGMSEDIISRIWEPFYTTKPIGQGSGLGLSLVYGFIKQSGGDILLESDPGKGTSVQIFLPVHDADPTLSSETAHMPAPQITVANAQSVLLIEDDLSVRKVLHDALDTLGIPTFAFSSAEEGLQYIRQNEPEIAAVLTDINLSGDLNGVQLAALVSDQHPAVPVLLTSGLPRSYLAEHFSLPEDSTVLTKPLRLRQMEQIFRTEHERTSN